MNTELPDERLSAYLDGELPADEVARLEAELAADPSLQADLDELSAVVRMLGEEGPVRAPLGFHHAVMQRIEEEYPAQPSWAWLRRPFGLPLEGLAVAAVALLVLAVVGLPTDTPPADVQAPEWRDVPPDPEADAAPAAMKRPSPKAEPDAQAPAEPAAGEAPGPSGEGKASGGADDPEGEAQKVAPQGKPPVAAGTDEDASSPPPAPLRTVPNSYDLFTEDVGSLRALLALVAKLGGTVTDLDGNPVTDAQLSSSRRDVLVSLPQGALADFQAELARLGTPRANFDDDRLLSGDTVSLQVSVQLSGGGVGTGADEATQRKPSRKMQFDEMMEAEAPEAR